MREELKLREVKLELVKSKTPSDVRKYRGIPSDTIDGHIMLGPSVGKPFKMFFENLTHEFYSSEIKHIQYVDDKTINFKTLNSEYKLTLGKEVNS